MSKEQLPSKNIENTDHERLPIRLIAGIAALGLMLAGGKAIDDHRRDTYIPPEKESTVYEEVMEFADNLENGKIQLPEDADQYTETLGKGDNLISVTKKVIKDNYDLSPDEENQARSTVFGTARSATERFIEKNGLRNNASLQPGTQFDITVTDINDDEVRDFLISGVRHNDQD